MFDCRGQLKSQKVLEEVKTGKQNSTILPVKHKIEGGGGGAFSLLCCKRVSIGGVPLTVDG